MGKKNPSVKEEKDEDPVPQVSANPSLGKRMGKLLKKFLPSCCSGRQHKEKDDVYVLARAPAVENISVATSPEEEPSVLKKTCTEFMDCVFGASDEQVATFIIYDENGKPEGKAIAADDISTILENGDYFVDDKIQKISVFRHVSENAAAWETKRIYHAFVVFKTDHASYSIERDLDGTTIRRSANYNDVACPLDESSGRSGYGHRETEWAEGRGTVGDVLRLLKDDILCNKYNMFTRNCQHFSAKVFKRFNCEGKTYKKYRKCQKWIFKQRQFRLDSASRWLIPKR